MADEKFIMLNLEDSKSKELAQVISSDTARKILSLLSEKSYSETDIAKELNIPLSTAHYNTQALLKSNIIEEKDFLWSEKGKKIKIYKLANKLIIISPKKQSSDFMDKLKTIIPVAIIGFVASAGLFIYKSILPVQKMASSLSPSLESTRELTMAASAMQIEKSFNSSNIAFWFFLGVSITIALYILIALIRRKNE